MKCNACNYKGTKDEWGAVEISSSADYANAIGTVGGVHLGAVYLVFCPKCGTVAVRDNFHKFELEAE